jgi:hypothetical protein
MFLCSNCSSITHVFHLKSYQAKLRLELAKPGKDGLEKTQEGSMDAFSKILSHNVGITKSTFLRNARLVASLSRTSSKFKSISKSSPIQALKEQLDAERATAAALRAAIVH